MNEKDIGKISLKHKDFIFSILINVKIPIDVRLLQALCGSIMADHNKIANKSMFNLSDVKKLQTINIISILIFLENVESRDSLMLSNAIIAKDYFLDIFNKNEYIFLNKMDVNIKNNIRYFHESLMTFATIFGINYFKSK